MRHRIQRAAHILPQLLLVGALVTAAIALAGCNGDGGPSPTASPTASSSPSTSPSPSASPSPSPSPSTSPVAMMTVRVYFLRGEKLGVAERRVPRTPAVAMAAMRELCAGPTAGEQEAGLGTTIPAGTEVLGISLRDGVATVDLSAAYGSGGGSLSMMARIAQVVYTLTQFPTVKSVSFALDGAPITALGGEGISVSPPQTRTDWVDFEPAIFVERPGVGAILASPFVLQGTARVFEGSFQAELRDDSGRRIARVTVQASEGAPGRGTFRKTVTFTTTATAGELTAYSVSMEDGSHQDEVSIPVTFAP